MNMTRVSRQMHDDDPIADDRRALKIAIEENQTAAVRAARLQVSALRSNNQLAEIDDELKALA
jgi:hypothetical protein